MKRKMNTIAAIAVALSAVFVATESFRGLLSRKRFEDQPEEYSPARECMLIVEDCTASLEHHSLSAVAPGQFQELINELDQLCEVSTSASNCVQRSLHLCKDERHKRQIETAISVEDFLCSERGKTLLRSYQNSVCYGEPTKIYEIQGGAEYCVAEAVFRPTTSNNGRPDCEQARETFQCIGNLVEDLCGETAGEIFEGVTSRILSVISEQECSNEEANLSNKRLMKQRRAICNINACTINNEYLKRGLDIFKKASK